MRRAALLGLLLAPAIAGASDLDAAIACVRSTVTSAFVPVTAGAEQLANVALARCSDEIESASVAMAGTPLVIARVEAARVAVRRELHGYAIAVTAGPVSDAGSDPAERRIAW